MVFSLVAPVSNEEATIPCFSAWIVAIMDHLGEPCELILVHEGETSFKVLTASFFYHLLAHLSSVPIPREVGDVRLLDRRVVEVQVGQRSQGAVERNSNPGFLMHRENLWCFRGGPCMNGTRQILLVRFQEGCENALQTRQILLSRYTDSRRLAFVR